MASTEKHCPVDGTTLQVRHYAGLQFYWCPCCGGMWFPAGVFDQVVQDCLANPRLSRLLDPRAGAAVCEHGFGRTLYCPDCGTEMSPGRYAGGVAAVEFDSCASCHGRWADGGELVALIDQLGTPAPGSSRALGEALAGAVREREHWRELARGTGELGRRVSLVDLFLPKIVLPLGAGVQVERFPLATVLLVLFCSLVYLLQAALVEQPQLFFVEFGLVPARIAAGRGLWGLVTHMFVHGGLVHLLGNMFFLWLFARAVEERLGRARFLLLYLACGLVAGLAYLVARAGAKMPAVGASGAVSGVLGMFLVLHPRASIPTLIIRHLVHLPAWLYLGFWGLLQLLAWWASGVAGGCACVAYSAHLGGFVAGLLLGLVARRSWVASAQ